MRDTLYIKEMNGRFFVFEESINGTSYDHAKIFDTLRESEMHIEIEELKYEALKMDQALSALQELLRLG